VTRVALLTSNEGTRQQFFRAGGIRFVADLLPYLKQRLDIEMYVTGPSDDLFEYHGVPVHIVSSRRIPFTDKRFLPPLNLDADAVLFLDYVAALSPNSARVNAVVFHHLSRSFHDEAPALYRRYFGIVGQLYLRAEYLLLARVRRKARLALAVSDVTVPYLEKLGFSAAVVGNGIDTTRYRPREKEDYAVAIGRLVNYKRFERALELSKRTGIPLKVIGTGPLERYLRRIAPRSVEFLGYLEEDEKIDVLSRAKYLFAFSAFEGFDLPVIEAMATYTVPVVSDIKAHRFIFSGEPVGFLVNSVDDAVAAVRRLERDDEPYEGMAVAARELVERKWSADVVAQRYLDVLCPLLSCG